MTTHTFTFKPENWLTDPTGRTFKAISDAMIAVGLVRTSDTGQINWSTINWTPTAGSQVAGYEIFRMDGVMSIKLEYGTSTCGASVGYNDTIGMWVTVGTGSNGSGMITGVLIPRTPTVSHISTAAPTGGAILSYLCKVPGFFGLLAFPSNTGASMALTLQALNSQVGDLSAGTDVYAIAGATSRAVPFKSSTALASTGFSWTAAAGAASAFIPGGYTGQINGKDPVFPHYAITPSPLPLVGTVTVDSAVFPLGVAFEAEVFPGLPHNYLSAGIALGYGDGVLQSSIAMLWE